MIKKEMIFFLSIILFQSCGFFETEKISKETFFEEDLKTITWNEIDQYPVFSACEDTIDKEAQKLCFETTLTQIIYNSIPAETIKVTTEINDTIEVYFSISKEATLTINELKVDSITKAQLPFIESWIMQSVGAIDLKAPAYKRGIPVSSKFMLPIVIQTTD